MDSAERGIVCFLFFLFLFFLNTGFFKIYFTWDPKSILKEKKTKQNKTKQKQKQNKNKKKLIINSIL